MNRRSFLKRTAMFTDALFVPAVADRTEQTEELVDDTFGSSPITRTEVLKSQRQLNIEYQDMLDELIRPMTERCERIMEGRT